MEKRKYLVSLDLSKIVGYESVRIASVILVLDKYFFNGCPDERTVY